MIVRQETPFSNSPDKTRYTIGLNKAEIAVLLEVIDTMVDCLPSTGVTARLHDSFYKIQKAFHTALEDKNEVSS